MYTKEERNIVYKKCLEDFELNLSKYMEDRPIVNYLCNQIRYRCLSELHGQEPRKGLLNYRSILETNLDYFPELVYVRPERLFNGNIWFPSDKVGIESRILKLKEMIQLTS